MYNLLQCSDNYSMTSGSMLIIIQVNLLLHLDNTDIDTEDLDIVIPMCNLLEYSDSYSMTSGSMWNYYRDEVISSEVSKRFLEIT